MLTVALLCLLAATHVHANGIRGYLFFEPPISSAVHVMNAASSYRVEWTVSAIDCTSKGRVDFDGLTYYPSIVFYVQKKLANGNYVVVDNAFKVVQCNLGATPIAFPEAIPNSWAEQGGMNGHLSREFQLGAYYLSGKTLWEEFEPEPFSLGVTIPFAMDNSSPAGICGDGCSGPTARCAASGCRCYAHFKLDMDYECVNENASPMPTPFGTPVPTPFGAPVATPVGSPMATPVGTPVAPTPIGAPMGTPAGSPGMTVEPATLAPTPFPTPIISSDCVISSTAYRLEKCSEICGEGTLKTYTPVLHPARGTGAACDCDHPDPAICKIQTVPCDGQIFNPDVDCDTLMMQGKLLGECRATEPKCDDGLECVNAPPPIATEHCHVKTGAEGLRCSFTGVPCDEGLECDEETNLCQKPKLGCYQCRCGVDKKCDERLVCSEERCVVPQAVVEKCAPGSQDCECDVSGGCLNDVLSCQAGKCKLVKKDVGQKDCAAGECEAACIAKSKCEDCLGALETDGIACFSCKDIANESQDICTSLKVRCKPQTARTECPAEVPIMEDHIPDPVEDATASKPAVAIAALFAAVAMF